MAAAKKPLTLKLEAAPIKETGTTNAQLESAKPKSPAALLAPEGASVTPPQVVVKPPATKAPLATSLAKAFAPAKTVAVPAGPVRKTAAAATKTPKVAKTVKPPKAVDDSKTAKIEKPKKPKLVRDSFTIPKSEYVVLEELKQRANQLAQPAKKSELLRAGIKALAAMSDANLQKALAQVPLIKTGRPAVED